MQKDFEDVERVPFVPHEIVRYLRSVYTTPSLLYRGKRDKMTHEETVGFMEGVEDVIGRLAAIADGGEEGG